MKIEILRTEYEPNAVCELITYQFMCENLPSIIWHTKYCTYSTKDLRKFINEQYRSGNV